MSDREQIDRAYEILRHCFSSGHKLLLCGNGGSAADCEHIAGELVKGMTKPTAGLPAFSLTSQTAVITAIANDIGAEAIFSQQISAYSKPGDVLLAISTSGKSHSVRDALMCAQTAGLYTIGLTGENTIIDSLCDVVIHCPGATTAEIQEAHIRVYHELCTRLEEEYFP